MFPVEIGPVGETAISETMEKMRLWLDHRRFEPAIFRFSLSSGHVVFRVDFTAEEEATAFAHEFGGTLAVS